MKKIFKIVLFILVCAVLCLGAAKTNSPYTGAGWDVNAPNDEALYGNAYLELQDLRKGIGIRMTKEHIAFAASSAGGEHRPGVCSILYYDATAAIDGNVAAGVFVHDGLIYDTTLEEFFTVDEAETGKVSLRIGTAGIADGNVMTSDIADGNVTLAKVNFVDGNSTLESNTDSNVPTVKATKTAIDTGLALKIPLTSIDCNTTLESNSDTNVPSVKAVKGALTLKSGLFTPATYAGEESTTHPNGEIFKRGYVARSGETTTVTFSGGTAFTAIVSCSITPLSSSGSSLAPTVNTFNTTTLSIDGASGYIGYYWQAWGY